MKTLKKEEMLKKDQVRDIVVLVFISDRRSACARTG
jgi:hypothetical protein